MQRSERSDECKAWHYTPEKAAHARAVGWVMSSHHLLQKNHLDIALPTLHAQQCRVAGAVQAECPLVGQREKRVDADADAIHADDIDVGRVAVEPQRSLGLQFGQRRGRGKPPDHRRNWRGRFTKPLTQLDCGSTESSRETT